MIMISVLCVYIRRVYILKCKVHFNSLRTVAGLLFSLWPQKSILIFMMSLIDFSLKKRFHLKVIKKANLHGTKLFLMENSSIIIVNEYLFKVTFIEFYSEIYT